MTPRNVLLLATFEVILAALLKIEVLEDVRSLQIGANTVVSKDRSAFIFRTSTP